MNILWLANFLPVPETNGGKVVIMNRLREVTKKHRVWLITINPDCATDEEMTELRKLCERLIVLDAPRIFKLTLLKLPKTPFNVARLYSKEWESAIGKAIRKEHFDLINIDLPMVFSNLYKHLDSICGTPIVINQHNIEFLSVRSKVYTQGVSLLRKLYSKIESGKLEKWERRLYKSIKDCAYTFVSDKDLEYFQNNLNVNNCPLFLSPIGTHVHAPMTDMNGMNPSRLIFVASFDYFPNIQGAIWMAQEVFPLIRKRIASAELYLVGRNPAEEVKRLSGNGIVVTGTVNDLSDYYESAALAVIPILSGGGVKTKLIEAGGYGIPVVSTTQGWMGTSYVQGVDILVADRAEDFAEACIHLLCSPQRAKELGSSMFERTKEKYQWENVAKDYCGFIERFAATIKK